MIKQVITGAALACLLFQGAQAKSVLLPMPIAEQLPVDIVTAQEEIAVTVPPNPGMAFGLVGALVGVAISNVQVANGEKRVSEIRNLLIDYPFNDRFEQALRTKLPSSGISPHPLFTVRKTPWEALSAEQRADTPADVLVLIPSYQLTNTFESMTVTLNAHMAHRSVKSNGKPKVEVGFARSYSMRIPMNKISGSTADEDAKRWIAMGKGSLHTLLDRASDQVTDMLIYDLSGDGRAEASKRVGAERTALKGETYVGRRIRGDADWVWTRNNNGKYQSLIGYYPVSGAPIVEASVTSATVDGVAGGKGPAQSVPVEASPSPQQGPL